MKTTAFVGEALEAETPSELLFLGAGPARGAR